MKNKGHLWDRIFIIANTLFYGLFSIICFFPFYYIFINTISNNSLVESGDVLFYPKGLHLDNYTQIFRIKGLANAFLVSILRTILGAVVSVVSASFVGYAMSKPEFWRKKFWYRFLIVTMYFQAGIIPTYINMKNLGLLNSFWVYVLPAIISPFNMILVKTYIESLPDSLEEAAIMDGGGYIVRFVKIVFPLIKPILATITVFSAVGQWNSFMDTIMYMTGNKFQTLQSILYKYLNETNSLAEQIKNSFGNVDVSLINQITPIAVRYTITTVIILPIILVYPIFQKYYVRGIMIGAVKG